MKNLLQKLFLLVALFFGGCSTVVEETNAIELAKGKTGTYYDKVAKTTKTFTISDDGLIYINYKTAEAEGESTVTDDPEADTEVEEYILVHVYSDTDTIEYAGIYKDSDDKNIYIKVVLSSITELNGVRTEYDKAGNAEHESGFTWYETEQS